MYLKFAKRVDLKCFCHPQKKRKGKEREESKIHEVMDMFISLIVVIISRRMGISKHQVVYLK